LSRSVGWIIRLYSTYLVEAFSLVFLEGFITGEWMVPSILCQETTRVLTPADPAPNVFRVHVELPPQGCPHHGADKSDDHLSFPIFQVRHVHGG
jgi:hypothetical protein